MIRDAIAFTLDTAIDYNADTVLLNAYGCGAFGNQPSHVAEIFARVLRDYKEKLAGKKIIFSDLNPASAYQFGDKFSSLLTNDFNVNRVQLDTGTVYLQLNKFAAPSENEVVIVPRNESDYFLELKHNPTITRDEIHARLQTLRQEVSISSNHRELILRVIKMVQADPSLLDPEKPFYGTPEFNLEHNVATRISTYLASHRGKRDIMQLSWFKEMKIRAIKHPSTIKATQALLDEMYHAKDFNWLVALADNSQIDATVKTKLQEQLYDLMSHELIIEKSLIEGELQIARRFPQTTQLAAH